MEERWLRCTLKKLILGLASLERTIYRQRSRIRWLQAGDANTQLFHLVANGRKTKNFIPALSVNGQIITNQKGKEDAFFDSYSDLLGRDVAQDHTLDLEFLGIEAVDLSELDMPFMEEEIWKVVKDMPADRAPGLDGFIGIFF